MDEFDKALVFAMKKWVADEINEIYDNKVCAVGVGLEKTAVGADAYICYNTEAQISATGAAPDDTASFKAPHFAVVDDDDAVYGSVDIWLDLKGYEKGTLDEKVCENFYECMEQTFSELCSDGIIKERFGKDIDLLVIRA